VLDREIRDACDLAVEHGVGHDEQRARAILGGGADRAF